MKTLKILEKIQKRKIEALKLEIYNSEEKLQQQQSILEELKTLEVRERQELFSYEQAQELVNYLTWNKQEQEKAITFIYELKDKINSLRKELNLEYVEMKKIETLIEQKIYKQKLLQEKLEVKFQDEFNIVKYANTKDSSLK